MLPLLAELRHALDMQAALELLVEEGDYCKVVYISFFVAVYVIGAALSNFFFVIGNLAL